MTSTLYRKRHANAHDRRPDEEKRASARRKGRVPETKLGKASAKVAYPQTMEAALPDKERVADTMARLKEAGVKYVFSCWIDILGLPKTKPVPLAELPALCAGEGPQFGVHSVSPVPELGPADPDQIMIPDLDSLLICPWNETYAWVFADLFLEDEPYNVCPRLALKRFVKTAADAGYKFFAGMEPEFMIMRYDENGRPVKAIDDDPLPGNGLRPNRQPFGYDLEFSLDGMPFLSVVIDYLEKLGWEPRNVVAEGAYSQFELDFGYTDLVGMADRFTFLRVMLKEIAKKDGYFVTYMPKPSQGDWRNGAHINHSVQSLDRPGTNLFEAPDGGWSDIVYHALGGLIEHGESIAAVTCPTVNSYKGLIGRARDFEGGTVTWAPTHICYGDNNRSAMFRLPQPRRAIENRASDMSINAYLGLAMTGAATLEGMSRRMDPGPPVNRSLYDVPAEELEKNAVKPVPQNLLDAIRVFEADPLAMETLGPTMHGMYSRCKHAEWERFHEHVTEWEKQEYLRFF